MKSFLLAWILLGLLVGPEGCRQSNADLVDKVVQTADRAVNLWKVVELYRGEHEQVAPDTLQAISSFAAQKVAEGRKELPFDEVQQLIRTSTVTYSPQHIGTAEIVIEIPTGVAGKERVIVNGLGETTTSR